MGANTPGGYPVVISSQPQTRVSSFSGGSPISQPKTQLAPGDAYVPSSVDPLMAAASGAVIGGGLGVYAGLSSGVLPALAGVVAGAGTGMVLGGLAGGIAGRILHPHNEWTSLDYALTAGKGGAALGAFAGGLTGALASGVGSAVALGVGGAVGGAVAAYFLAQANA